MNKLYYILFFLGVTTTVLQAQSDGTSRNKIDKSFIGGDFKVVHDADSVYINRVNSVKQEGNTGDKNPLAFSDSLKYSVGANSISDSIQTNLNNANDKTEHAVHVAKSKTDSLAQKVSLRAGRLQQKQENKLPTATEKITIPKLAESNLPAITTQVSLPSVRTDDLPSGLEIPMPEGDALNLPSTDVKKLPDTDLPQVPELKDVNSISGDIAGVDGKLSEVSQYKNDLQKLNEDTQKNLDKLSEQAEQKLTDVPEVGTATEELAKATEEQAKYEAMIQRYRDQKLLQEEITRKYKNVANDYVMQQSEKLNVARDKLNTSKYRKHGLGSVKEVLKKQSDELEEKKFYQRLVPGLNWQIYKKGFVSSDISLQTGYRITPRLTSGIGVVYRVGFDKKFDSFVKGMKTFGGRVYIDMLVVKGMFLHGEFEALKQDVSYKLYTNEPVSPRVYESNFGLGKRFNITRSIRGNIIAIYRIEYQGELPAANKINVRMGIDYVFRRPKKKLNGL